MAAELYAVLEEAQTWKEDQYVCPKSAARYNKVDRNGKNVGVNLINIDVLRVIRWIGLEPSVAVPGRSKKMTVYAFILSDMLLPVSVQNPASPKRFYYPYSVRILKSPTNITPTLEMQHNDRQLTRSVAP